MPVACPEQRPAPRPESAAKVHNVLPCRHRIRNRAHFVEPLVDAALDQDSHVSPRRVRLLSVVSPTLNEIENVGPLVRRLSDVLAALPHEILIVDDDSEDQTWRRVAELAGSVRQLRLLRRFEKHGLGLAVMDGLAASAGDAVACIDSDLQHDPAILPQMVAELEGGAGLVVGCRYMLGGGATGWNWLRRFESLCATRLAQVCLGTPLRDPLSGYFAMWKNDFMRIRERLDGTGFKILLEIAAHLQPTRVSEVPYYFRPRQHGKSKLTGRIVLQYLAQLWRLRNAGDGVRRRPTR